MKKKNILVSLLACLPLAFVCVSCHDRLYADADYPETKIYQPMAIDKVWLIDKPNDPNASPYSTGGTQRYIIDEANNKFIVPMGVVQAGIKLETFEVEVNVDHSYLNKMILDGNDLPVGTLPLSRAAYDLPASVMVNSSNQSASFNLEIDLRALIGANFGKKFALAVRIDSPKVAVSEGLGTCVICIDTAFLADLLL